MKSTLFADLEPFQVYPIGFIHREKDEMFIEVLPPFRPALKLLDHFSHITVLFWAHQHASDQERNDIELRVEPPYAPGKMTGIFATRSDYRPNPILSTPCKIESIDEDNGIIKVKLIDGFDGSPVLDIKGYFPVMDRVNDARIPDWLDWGIDHVPDEGLDLYENMED